MSFFFQGRKANSDLRIEHGWVGLLGEAEEGPALLPSFPVLSLSGRAGWCHSGQEVTCETVAAAAGGVTAPKSSGQGSQPPRLGSCQGRPTCCSRAFTQPRTPGPLFCSCIQQTLSQLQLQSSLLSRWLLLCMLRWQISDGVAQTGCAVNIWAT